MNIYAFLSLLSAAIITALGVTIYGVSGRNKNSSIFLLVTIGVGFLNFTQFQMRITHDYQFAYLWAKAYSLWPLILAFSAQFVLDLKVQKNRSILFYIAIYFPALAIAYIQFSTHLITLAPVEKSWGWTIQYNQGIFPTLATLVGLIYWIQILVTLLLYIRSKTGILKKQAKLIFVGFLFYFLGILIIDDILPQLNIAIPELGNVCGIVTFILAGYGIVYYDVFTFSKDSVSRKLFSSISNYLILVDANNTIIEINSHLLKLLNYKHEQVIGQKLKFIVASDISQTNPLNKEMSTSGEFSNERIILKTNNNGTVELVFSASPVKVSNSKKAGFVYIGSQEKLDIRQSQSFEEHKKHTRFLAEAALDLFLFQKKEDVYFYITEHIYNLLNKEAIVTFAEFSQKSDVVHWEMKSITGIHHRLRSMIKLLGFDPHKMKSTATNDIHKNIIKGKLTNLEFDLEKLTNGLIPNKIGEKVKDLFKVKDVSVISLQHGIYNFGTLTILRKDEAPRINNELIESFMAIAAMVLNRQRAEFELGQSEKRFRSIVENSQLSIFIIDLEGNFLLAEGGDLSKFGVKQEEMKSNNVFDLAKNNMEITNHMKRALSGEVFNVLFSYKHYHFNITFTPFFNEKEELIGTLGMSNDITDRVDSELKLKDFNEMLNKLISVIGHDLKGAISNVISFSDILLNDFNAYPKNQIEEFTKLIRNAAVNGNTILGGLIEWHKSVQGESTLKIETFNIKEITDEAVEQVSSSADTKKISISNDIDEDLTLTLDKNMVLTTVRNLLSNAIKFTKQKGKISLYSSSNEETTKIYVIDSGIGMTENRVKSLFDFRSIFVGQGTDGETGSGLGLQICKDFVERNNGKILVESELGKGTTFILDFPTPDNKEQNETVESITEKETLHR